MAVVTKGNEEREPRPADGDEEKSLARADARKREEDNADEGQDKGPPPSSAVVASGGGFLSVHKPGQGYWTRMGTAATVAALLFFTSHFVYSTVRFRLGIEPEARALKWGVIAAAIFALPAIVLAWWYLNKTSVVEFLIATESEMKKVNWTSRKDLIGSTKVVIFFMFLIAFILFMIDIVFGYFFQSINVLKHGPFQ